MANPIIRAAPTENRLTHHMKLSDGTTEIGIILCNGKGEPDPRAIRPSGVPRTSLQIRQGDPDYSDYEMPYVSHTQKDFSGGRGNEAFEKDKARYTDSYNLDTSAGDIILAPAPIGVKLGSVLPSVQSQAVPDNPGGGSNYVQCWADAPFTPTYLVDAELPDRNYYWKALKQGEHLDTVTWAKRFQYGMDYPLKSVTLRLWHVNRLRVSIVKCTNLPVGTAAKRELADACVTGITSPGSVYEVVATVDDVTDYVYDPFEADITVEIPLRASLEKNEYYMLAVTSMTPQTYVIPDYEGQIQATYPAFEKGIAAGLEIKAVRGNWTAYYNPGTEIALNRTDVFSYDAASGTSFVYTLNAESITPGKTRLFRYRGSLMGVFSPADGSAPKLYIEGAHGMVPSANADKKKINVVAAAADYVGGFIKIRSGKGSAQDISWRPIKGYTAGAPPSLTIEPAWDIAPDTTSEYAIFGLPETVAWTEIVGHLLTKPITDVLVVDDIIYFAQGEDQTTDAPICAMNGYNNAGVWTWRWRLEPVATRGTFLAHIQDSTGKRQIWMAKRQAVHLFYSDVKPYGTDLALGSPFTCGDTNYRITGIQAYGEPRVPYIHKEDGIGSFKDGIYDQLPISEFEAVADDSNGRAHLQRGVYLYLSMLNGIERYYENRLDDVGMNRDMGMPGIRTASVSKLLPYPGRMYALIDHPTGNSSIMLYNNIGWHEIYRSGYKERAHDLIVQVLPGDACDRLFLTTDYGVKFFSVAIDPLKQAGYRYNRYGELISSWISGGFKEVKKFWKSIKLFMEGTGMYSTPEGWKLSRYAFVSYQVDTETNPWRAVPYAYSDMPVDEQLLSEYYDVAGTRLRYKISLVTEEPTKTPQLKAITIDSVLRLPVKRAWTITFFASDHGLDLQNQVIPMDFKDLQNIFDRWGDPNQTPVPISVTYMHETIDAGKKMFVDPLSFTPLEVVASENGGQYSEVQHTIKNICQLTLYEA